MRTAKETCCEHLFILGADFSAPSINICAGEGSGTNI